jgi:hypothetical protein
MALVCWRPLRTAALKLLRLAGFDHIREGLRAVMHETSRHCW